MNNQRGWQLCCFELIYITYILSGSKFISITSISFQKLRQALDKFEWNLEPFITINQVLAKTFKGQKAVCGR